MPLRPSTSFPDASFPGWSTRLPRCATSGRQDWPPGEDAATGRARTPRLRKPKVVVGLDDQNVTSGSDHGRRVTPGLDTVHRCSRTSSLPISPSILTTCWCHQCRQSPSVAYRRARPSASHRCRGPLVLQTARRARRRRARRARRFPSWMRIDEHVLVVQKTTSSPATASQRLARPADVNVMPAAAPFVVEGGERDVAALAAKPATRDTWKGTVNSAAG